MTAPNQTTEQLWPLSWRFDPVGAAMADRHYSRKTVGSPQFVAPGRCLVLRRPRSLWVTSWPEFAQHEWAGAWMCSIFRNEGDRVLSSDLIRHAVAASVWKWPEIPELGMVTFVDPRAVRPKRDPGYCFLQAGFRPVGRTRDHGYLALQLLPADMPAASMPIGAQPELVSA